MNQVYFHHVYGAVRWLRCFPRLNPFENQVYFHLMVSPSCTRTASCRLNPFENQVYFHLMVSSWKFGSALGCVLIPLRIRSISTHEEKVFFRRVVPYVLIPLRIRSISTREGKPQDRCWHGPVLIPLRIRSISTMFCRCSHRIFEKGCLNPFENQVYFH